MACTGVVRARIDGRVKEEAANVLTQIGLSVSDVIRILLIRITADKALLFDINRAHAQPDSKAP
jgi:DNA-damage-inducible protein J